MHETLTLQAMKFQTNKLWPVLLLTGFLFLFSNPLTAQILKPVSWEVSAEKTGNNEYTLIYKAKIEDGWKVYANDIEPGGPIPTTINYDKLPKGVSPERGAAAAGKERRSD
jgi:hypothetical protein